MDIISLKEAIKNRRIEWQRHSLERMLERNISRSAVIETILNGDIIEDYSQDKPFPSGLILGWMDQKPIHVVASYDPDTQKVYIITAYKPELEHFKPGFKTRRKR